jgi:peroxiredoxin
MRGGIVVLTVCAAAVLPAGVPAEGRQQGQGQRAGRGIQPSEYPVLAIGASLPDFSLLGIDGKRHSAKEYAAAKVLAVVFESNHCPASIAYEQRIHDLYDKYRSRGVQIVAINPNNPKAVRLNELGFTDMSDSFEEMKIRAAFMKLPWPYLYDGETQVVSKAFGAVATPHIFVFDQDRKLRYQGAIDDSRAVARVKQRYADDAIDAVLAGRPVGVTESRALGCTTKWLEKSVDGVEKEMKAIQATEVTMAEADSAALKALRDNATSKKTLLVSFWQVDNKVSQAQFEPLQTTYRMYAGSKRPVDVVTVSTDPAAKTAAVHDYLRRQYATTTNLHAPGGAAEAMTAFGLKWNAAQPFTVVIGPDGKVLFQRQGAIDIYEVRRHILASIPDEPAWPGIHEYYNAAVARMAKGGK